jgi:uncharacterized protein
MSNAFPAELQHKSYISLTTFRKNGIAVPTPVWFAESGGKIYVMSKNDSGKCKRIRNNPQVRIAPCNVRGKVTGPEFPAHARILPPEESKLGQEAIRAKYWMTRISALWSRNNVYVEITA